MAVVSQLLGASTNVQTAVAQIRSVINVNQDVKQAIDASVGATMPKTPQELENARIQAIAAAMARNPAFAAAIRNALGLPPV